MENGILLKSNLPTLKTLVLQSIQTHYENTDMHRKRNKKATIAKVEILIQEDYFFLF